MYGYMGKLLFVDLSNGALWEEALDEETACNFMGGQGLGAKVLYEHMPAHADVFGEESMIGFVSGPLNNTGALYGGRYTVVSKSPVTGGWNDANSAGFFGERLRKSGFDGIFVRGISPRPVYLLVDNGQAQIMDASALWGLCIAEGEALLKKRHGEQIGTAQIGPGGEYLSHMAAIMNDGHRAAGRGGSGAVMGSKKLKAVVVRGSMKTPVADPRQLSRINWDIRVQELKSLLRKSNERDFFFHGTGGTFVDSVKTADVGFKNWSGTNQLYTEEDAKALSSQGLKKYKKKRFYCSHCDIGCSVYMDIKSDEWGTFQTTRPEYETMGAFGPLLLNKNVPSVCKANELCNQYGLDTMSVGSTIAWAMECYNRGVLSEEELDGIALPWGDASDACGAAVVKLIERMGANQGIGAILLKGSQKAAEILGKGEEYLVVANGIEQPQHDARLNYGLGRTYLADPTPGRHVKGAIGGVTTDPGFDPAVTLRHTGEADRDAVQNNELMNASGSCAFGYENAGFGPTILRNLNAVTGFDYTEEAFYQTGLRIFTMRQAFNLREGITRSKFYLSRRIRRPSFHTALEDTPLDFDGMVDNLYAALDWSSEGVPTREALEALGGLDAVIRDIYGAEAG